MYLNLQSWWCVYGTSVVNVGSIFLKVTILQCKIHVGFCIDGSGLVLVKPEPDKRHIRTWIDNNSAVAIFLGTILHNEAAGCKVRWTDHPSRIRNKYKTKNEIYLVLRKASELGQLKVATLVNSSLFLSVSGALLMSSSLWWTARVRLNFWAPVSSKTTLSPGSVHSINACGSLCSTSWSPVWLILHSESFENFSWPRK